MAFRMIASSCCKGCSHGVTVTLLVQQGAAAHTQLQGRRGLLCLSCKFPYSRMLQPDTA